MHACDGHHHIHTYMHTNRRLGYGQSFEAVEIPLIEKRAHWVCRYPISEGRVCMRQEIRTCPIHGPLIARGVDGAPADPAEAERVSKMMAERAMKQPRPIKRKYPGLVNININKATKRK